MSHEPWDDLSSDVASLADQITRLALPVIAAAYQRQAEPHGSAAVFDDTERVHRQIQLSIDRSRWMHAADPSWLAHARISDLVTAWSAAATWADDDPSAALIVTRVESALKHRDLKAMTAYEELRATGLEAGEAMKQCAHLFTAADVEIPHQPMTPDDRMRAPWHDEASGHQIDDASVPSMTSGPERTATQIAADSFPATPTKARSQIRPPRPPQPTPRTGLRR